jgi:hypothetical protein
MILQVPCNVENFLTSWTTISFSGSTPLRKVIFLSMHSPLHSLYKYTTLHSSTHAFTLAQFGLPIHLNRVGSMYSL